ncbi:hypothetical protein KKD62_02135 [Patescibacteria group bacterium]|nr:hypothetical protein [Patescibacteria group bacterium]MBU1931197.1 hypothetical protein [Patescibacteria group bacterium]
MIEIFILTFKITIILFFVGYGFGALMLPKKLQRWNFWLSPWLAIILISVIGAIFSLLKIPMSKANQIILIIASSLHLVAIFMKKIYFKITKENFFIGLLTTFGLLLTLYPLIVRAGFPTTLTIGNLDPISYCTTADWLTNHTIYPRMADQYYKPASTSVGDLIYYSYRWGSPMLLSFFASLLSLQSFQIFSILLHLLFALSFPLVYILAKTTGPKHQPYLLLLVFVGYSLNSTLFYILYHVFFGQFAFTGVFILTIILLISYSNDKTRRFTKYDFLIALSFSAISSIYPEGLVFALAPLVMFVIWRLFNLKSRRLHLLRLGKITLLTVLINPITVGTAIYQILKVFHLSTDTTFIGWEKINYANPFDIMGFYNLFYSRPIPEFLGWLIGLPVVAIWLFGLKKTKQRDLISVYLLMFLAFGLSYRFIINNFYAYFRLITYAIFILVVLFSIGLSCWLGKIKNQIIKLAVLLVVFGLSSRSAHRLLKQVYWHPTIIDPSLISLNELNQASLNQPFFTDDIYLGDYSLWKRFWREYFLTNQKIITHNNYYTNYRGRLGLDNIKLVLAEKNNLTVGNKTLVYKTILWENQYYQLGEIEDLEIAEDLIPK